MYEKEWANQRSRFLSYTVENLSWHLHFHAAFEICIVLKGVIEITVDGALYTLGIDKANVHVTLTGIVLVVMVDLCNEKGIQIRRHLMNQSLWMRWPVLLCTIVLIFVLGIWGAGYDASDFIYAQF